MKIKIPMSAPPPQKYRSLDIAGDVGQQLSLYHQVLSKEAQKSGAEVPLEYVVKEMLREACKADPERRRIKPRPPVTKLKNIEVEGDVAVALQDYMKKLGLEEPDYVVEQLLAMFLRGDRKFQQTIRELEEASAEKEPATKSAPAATSAASPVNPGRPAVA